MDGATAYRSGYRAAMRSETGNMEPEEGRFITEHGQLLAAFFAVGWIDAEAGAPYGDSLAGTGPIPEDNDD